MEHSTSAVNWQPRNLAKAPGRDAAQLAAARRARRRRRAVLPVASVARRRGEVPLRPGPARRAPTPKVWREVVALGATCGRSPRSPVRASSSLRRSRSLFDWPSWWAAALDSHPSVDVDPLAELRRWHAGAAGAQRRRRHRRSGRTTSAVPRRHRGAVQYLIDDTAAARLDAFVRAGRDAGRDVLHRHRRRARPHPARRLPRRAAGTARRADRGVLPAAAGRVGRADGIRAGPRLERARSLVDAEAPTCSRRTPTVHAPVPGDHPPRVGAGRRLVRRAPQLADCGLQSCWTRMLAEAGVEPVLPGSAGRRRGRAPGRRCDASYAVPDQPHGTTCRCPFPGSDLLTGGRAGPVTVVARRRRCRSYRES